MSTLRKFLFLARAHLDEFSVQEIKEVSLIAAANEGKNEIVKIIRSARQDFFESYDDITLPVAASNDPTEADLPTDLAVIKDLSIIQAGFEDIQFRHVDRAHPDFISATRATGLGWTVSNGCTLLWDINEDRPPVLKVAPGLDRTLECKVVYDAVVADMVLPDDSPAGIPLEHLDYIVTWMVVSALRTRADVRLDSFLGKLRDQEMLIRSSVGVRQVRELEFVRGYLEEEGW